MSAEQVIDTLKSGQEIIVRYVNTSGKLAKRGVRYLKLNLVGYKRNPGWQDKALERWTMNELVDFFLQNKKDFHIGIKFITRLEDCEMDGSMLHMMLQDKDEGDEILCKSLKVEKYVIKKIRNKIAAMTFDHEKVAHEKEIEYLLEKIVVDKKGDTLLKYRDVLLDDTETGQIGLSRVTELPSLIEEEGFFRKLNLNFTEEAREPFGPQLAPCLPSCSPAHSISFSKFSSVATRACGACSLPANPSQPPDTQRRVGA